MRVFFVGQKRDGKGLEVAFDAHDGVEDFGRDVVFKCDCVDGVCDVALCVCVRGDGQKSQNKQFSHALPLQICAEILPQLSLKFANLGDFMRYFGGELW